MTLGEKQRLFSRLLADLIRWAYEHGYEVTMGECFRTPEQAALNAQKGIGVKDSLHTKRLAVDLNLFVNGEYMPTTEAHKPLGEYWESLNPLCRWGGRFTKPDGNHYELRDA